VALVALQSDERRALAGGGYAQLEDLWDSAVADDLRREARVGWSSAAPPPDGPRTPVSEGRARGRPTPVATGPLLSRLHADLVRVARAVSGQLLAPTFAVYGYFPFDDEVVLHRDTDATDVVLLTTVLGRVGPLRLHPELEDATNDELGRLESDPAWDGASGVPVTYPRLGVCAFRGRRIPHHRRGRPVAELSAVAALHYRAVFR